MAKKKNVSSWKKKKTYTILSPENFDSKELGVTVASDPKLLTGRTVNTSLAELVDDRRKQHLKLVFEVIRVEKENAYTRFKKFFTPVGYLRYKIRKGSSKIDIIQDDEYAGEKLRIKVMVLSRWKLSGSQRKEVSAIVKKVLEENTKSTPEQMVQMTLFGKLGTEIYKKVRVIAPIARVEVHHIARL